MSTKTKSTFLTKACQLRLQLPCPLDLLTAIADFELMRNQDQLQDQQKKRNIANWEKVEE